MTYKVSSRNIKYREVKTLIVPAVPQDSVECERRARQLVFMARETHPEITRDDLRQELIDGEYYWTVCVGESHQGRNYNELVYGPTRFVEDLVD